jgi:predicted pyridoxine 5'-phosphate oxidase superfamily flavin-nucleotide-binding protein
VYHQGNRELQDHFHSRRLADRLEEKLRRDRFTDEDAEFIGSLPFFFLATADAEGRPDCSFKGGLPGFVQVAAPDLLVFPDYDGNGMFKSLGNLRVNPHVGLLFIGMEETPKRLRVNGVAEIAFEDPMLEGMAGGQLLVKVTPHDIFPNCPRNIPRMKLEEHSIYAPRPDAEPVEPKWKSFEIFDGLVPPRRR